MKERLLLLHIEPVHRHHNGNSIHWILVIVAGVGTDRGRRRKISETNRLRPANSVDRVLSHIGAACPN